MRIVFGIPFLYPALAYGGAARAAYHLAEALHNLGQDVSVLTTDVWDSTSRWRPNGFHIPFEVIRLRNVSNWAAYHLQFYTPRNMLPESESLLAHADIVHLHTFRNLLNDGIARVAVKRGIPVVVSGHGTIPRIERFRTIKRGYDLLLGNWQLQNASGFIAVSRNEARRILRKIPEDTPVSIIPNGVSKIEVPEWGLFRKKWALGPEEKIVLFLGKITQRKGVQHLVRAFHHLRSEARLVIAGNDMGYANEIRKLIFDLHLERHVIWTGLLSDTEKYQALRDADITVYPSVREAFGLVPLESLLCRTPVIVCGDDGCGETIRKTGSGEIVWWGDVKGLEFAIRNQLKKGKNPQALQQSANYIREHFAWPLIATASAAFYQNLLDLARNPSPAAV